MTRQVSKRRIGVLTGGGDCPGLNAVIRAVAKTAMNECGMEVVGFKDGFTGLIEGRFQRLANKDVSGILTLGGTILGTTNRDDPFKHPETRKGKLVFRDRSARCVALCRKLRLDALVCIGGDGTMSISQRLNEKGIPVVGVPKTIDNDLVGTDITFGFDSAVTTAAEAIDKLHTTAMSHHRVMVIEVMGRYAGWLGLHAGIAGGGDVILIPEIPFDIQKVCERVKDRNRRGKRFSIVVVAEGAKPKGGVLVVKKVVEGSHDKLRLGGIGQQVGDEIERRTGLETRVTVLGHLQRGGTPTAFDRILATRFGSEAVKLIAREEFGRMVSLRGQDVASVPLSEAAGKQRLVPPDSPLIAVARSVGTCFGD
ncbi:MAG: 6-phosphofructokinase [Planctomycetes bacterium]|nr:6-phosphofructokinase [Planctomycetota bacterium]